MTRVALHCVTVLCVATLGFGCTMRPKGYVDASATDLQALARLASALESGCQSRLAKGDDGETTGTFLAEVQPFGPSLGFQMEGVWRSGSGKGADGIQAFETFHSFEAQFLSPLGEAWAQFTLGALGGQVRYGQALQATQKETLQRFVGTLATLGAKNLRDVSCGRGLIALKNRVAYVEKSEPSAAAATLPAESIRGISLPRTIVKGKLRVSETDVLVETTLERRTGAGSPDVRLESLMKAGLWGTQGGRIAWEGDDAKTASGPTLVPRRLVVERDAREGATLTFLEYE